MDKPTAKKPKGKKKSLMQLKVEAHKRSQALNMVTANIGNLTESTSHRLAKVLDDLKADGEGIHDYEAELFKLNKRKQELLRENEKLSEWAANFDRHIGPFEARYAVLKTSINGLYCVAKDKHAAALKLLAKHFRYHPAFRRYNDDFTAVPFKPK